MPQSRLLRFIFRIFAERCIYIHVSCLHYMDRVEDRMLLSSHSQEVRPPVQTIIFLGYNILEITDVSSFCSCGRDRDERTNYCLVCRM